MSKLVSSCLALALLSSLVVACSGAEPSAEAPAASTDEKLLAGTPVLYGCYLAPSPTDCGRQRIECANVDPKGTYDVQYDWGNGDWESSTNWTLDRELLGGAYFSTNKIAATNVRACARGLAYGPNGGFPAVTWACTAPMLSLRPPVGCSSGDPDGCGSRKC